MTRNVSEMCPKHGKAGAVAPRVRRGFTLVDVLVSLTVITVLMGLLLPSLSGIRETTRRVVCSSNIRQFGLGIAMYTEDNRGYIPYSNFISWQESDPKYRPDRMMIVRDVNNNAWDGLGLLFSRQYTPAAGIYYCPSHKGEHRKEVYESAWSSTQGEIVSNFHYRGVSPGGNALLRLWTGSSAIVADGLATQQDYNHVEGNNTLRADISVAWVVDRFGQINNVLAKSEEDMQAPLRVRMAWQEIDRAANAAEAAMGGGPTGPN
ncbi:MAG: type II secretion system protein [Phycisphaerales bacterium]|nr:type II secretion system protein [Phycisphaerales bacterium]